MFMLPPHLEKAHSAWEAICIIHEFIRLMIWFSLISGIVLEAGNKKAEKTLLPPAFKEATIFWQEIIILVQWQGSYTYNTVVGDNEVYF